MATLGFLPASIPCLDKPPIAETAPLSAREGDLPACLQMGLHAVTQRRLRYALRRTG